MKTPIYRYIFPPVNLSYVNLIHQGPNGDTKVEIDLPPLQTQTNTISATTLNAT